MGKVPAAASATILAEFAGRVKAAQLADLALGREASRLQLRSLQDQEKDDEDRPDKVDVNFACFQPSRAEKAWAGAGGSPTAW